MAHTNVLLIRRKGSILDKILAGIAKRDTVDTSHYLFIPGKFVFGPFVSSKKGFQVYSHMIYDEGFKSILKIVFEYADSTEDLKKYQKAIDSGTWEVVRSAHIPEGELESIIDKAKAYFQAREAAKQTKSKLTEEAGSIIKYFD